ncbi:carbohydrate binding domain-containing protein [Streptomyces shenzhenensis]|uniref:carbohydrate binding domain-containing protein n=1 Tax=Streptomyces shenzhenensis TaxID=943815 RepID=UPI003D94C14F
MTFPATPLKIVTELEIDGVLQDISADVYNRDPVVITRGRADEGAAVDPGQCRLTLNNGRSKINGVIGRYSPRNPRSDLYGKLGRNTRLRVSVHEGWVFLDNPSGEPDLTTTPDAAPVKITGDIDVRWEGTAEWYSNGAQILVGKWGVPGNRSWHMRLENGRLFIHTTQDGATGRFFSAPLPANLPRRAALRAVLDVDNGSGGNTAHLYWSESMAGPWQDIAGAIINTGGVIAIYDSTAPLSIAPQMTDAALAVLRYPFTGRCFRAEVRSGIDGAVVASPNFEAQALGTTSFADGAGRTWTIGPGAAITNRRSRFVGEVSEWPTRWEYAASDGRDGYVPLVASGVLRRMTQGKKPLDSALFRRIPTYNPTAYWPLEGTSDGTSAASPIAGVDPLSWTNVKWGADTSLVSSGPLPTLSSNSGDLSFMRAPIPTSKLRVTDRWGVQFLVKLTNPQATTYTVMRILATNTVYEWFIQVNSGGFRLWARNGDGDTLVDANVVWGFLGNVYDTWLKCEFNVVQTATNTITWHIGWVPPTGSAAQQNGTLSGRIGRPVGLASPAGGYSSNLDGTAFGHISVWPLDDNFGYENAISAWSGESAGTRMFRLAAEEQLPLVVRNGTDTQTPVGPQRTDPILTILQDAADADGGILFENREDIGLAFRSRTGFYNQPVALALDFNAKGLITPLEPIDDDQLLRNDRTIEREDGTPGHAVLESGPLSVQDPPLGVGVYNDSTTLNLATDDQTEPVANWYLHVGTYDQARYPSIAVDLRRAPWLISAAADTEVGDRLTVANPPEWLPPGLIDQRVEGYRETLSLMQWVIEYNCTPQGVYNTASVDGRERGLTQHTPAVKVDTDGSELAQAMTDSTQVANVHITDGPNWIQAPPPGTPNPLFLTDTSGWNASGSTIDRVPAPNPPTSSGYALSITPNGSSATVQAYTTTVAGAVPGVRYVVSGWARASVARQVGININWYNSGAYVSTSNNAKTIPADTWTWFEATFTAPSGVNGISAVAAMTGTPPATHVLLIQGVTILPVLGSAAPREFPFSVTVGGEEMRVLGILDYADTFQRATASGWGSAEYGQSWTLSGGASADYSVAVGTGSILHTNVNTNRIAVLPAPSADVDLIGTVSSNKRAAGGSQYTGLVARYVDAANHYYARLDFTATQTLRLVIQRRQAGAQADLVALTVPGTHDAGSQFRVRFQLEGSALRAKAWPAASPEPSDWQATTTDTALSAAGSVGVRTVLDSASTVALPVSMNVHAFKVDHYQRWGVDRAVNGVVKPQSAGQAVNVTYPAVVAL